MPVAVPWKKAFVITTYSPDDGGFYADVYEYKTGKTIGDTEIVECRELARQHGYALAKRRGYVVAQYKEI